MQSSSAICQRVQLPKISYLIYFQVFAVQACEGLATLFHVNFVSSQMLFFIFLRNQLVNLRITFLSAAHHSCIESHSLFRLVLDYLISSYELWEPYISLDSSAGLFAN
jgi:hypothetical protein